MEARAQEVGLNPAYATLLCNAYKGENGLAAEDQSALNLLYQMAPNPDQTFHMLGESDERYRAKGGNGAIITALMQALQPFVESGLVQIHNGYALQHVEPMGEGYQLDFTNGTSVQAEAVNFAIPFSVLRGIDGIDSIGMSEEKIADIQGLGYGLHTKLSFKIKDLSWKTDQEVAFGPLNGTMYSTESYLQNFWVSHWDPEAQEGVLTFLIGAPESLESGLAAKCRASFAQLVGRSEEALFAEMQPISAQRWHSDGHAKGSYCCPKPGQFTTFLMQAMSPECGGAISFTGEHTGGEGYGFANAAVESGYREAERVVARLATRHVADVAGLTAIQTEQRVR